MAEVGTLFVRLKADASEFEQTMQGISGTVEGAGKKIQGTGTSMTKGITAPLLGVAGAALTVGMGFDDQMAKVQAISGATGDDFETLRGTALELGATTRFSASEAAEGLEFLALAGWDANEMADGLGGVLDLASASGMDLGRTSDIVTDTMSAFGIAAEDSSEVADMFAVASSNSNTSVEQLGSALGKAGPILASMGMGLDESQAALGLLANQGLKGSRAGTSLSAVMRDLTANAEDGVTSFGDFDVAIYDAQGNMRPFGDILADLEDGLEGMSDEQRNAALSSVFQQQALQGINPLLSEGADRYEELRSGIENSEGASKAMSATMEDTLGGSLRALKSQFEGILIQLSDQLAPIIRDTVIPVVQQLGEFISRLIDWFSNLDPRIQTVVLAIAGIAAALGPVLVAIGTLMIVLAPVVGLFGALISPVGLVVAAIAALAAGLIYAYTQSETFRNIVDTVVGFIRDVAVAAFELISERLREFADTVLPHLIETWEFLRDKISEAVNFIWNSVILPVFDAIKGFIEEHSDTIEAVLAGAWEIIESTISTAIDVIEGIIIGFLALIRGDWETAWEAVKGIADSLWEHLKTVFGNVKDFIVGVFDTLVGDTWETVSGWVSDLIGAAGDLFSDFTGWISDLYSDVTGFISDMASEAWETVSGWVSDLVGAAGDLLADFGSAVSDLYSDVTGFISDMASEAWTTVSGWVSDLVGAAGDLLSDFGSAVSDLYSDVTGFISDMASEAWDTVSGMVSDIVTEAGNMATDVISEVSGMAGDFITEVVGLAIDVVTEFAGMATDVFHEVTGMATEVVGEIKTLPGRILGALPDAFGVLRDWGANVVQGLINGISSRIGDLAGKVGELRGLLPGSPAKWGPLRDVTKNPDIVFAPFASDLMGGLTSNIERGLPGLESALAGIDGRLALEAVPVSGGGAQGQLPTINFNNPTIVSKDNREPDDVLNDAAWASITALRRRGHR